MKSHLEEDVHNTIGVQDSGQEMDTSALYFKELHNTRSFDHNLSRPTPRQSCRVRYCVLGT